MIRSIRNSALVLAQASLLLSLAACNKSADTAASAPAASAPSLADLNNPKAVAKAVNNTLPQGDKATPLTSYRKLDSGHQVMFLYFGMLNLPVPYEDIAEVYSAEYARSNDSFQRKDIIKALTPRIDQEIARAKASPYIMLEQSASNLLERYNFDKKSFTIKEMTSNDRYTYFNDNSRYTLGQTNATDFSALPVTDETKAREIEGYLSKYANLRMEVYCFAQDADPSARRVKLQVMKVRLFSPSNQLLAEM
ncbi:hypothetical protein [Duganella fentianensis]|uniref:hypothetical protein n=1 Tax=Duganella fentianensis TaxID=2692177 RepID=UPI0032B2A93B